MSDFKLGDLVRLKSSSPDMTVTTIRSDDGVQTIGCVYYKAYTGFRTEAFPATSLEKVTDNTPPEISED